MEVIRQNNLTVYRIANSFKGSNTYIIAPQDVSHVWLVDIGDVPDLLSVIEDRDIVGIFLTHAHLDHIYGLKEILGLYPTCIVYGSEKCHEYLFDDRKNLSFYYERPLSLPPMHFIEVGDPECVKLSGGYSMESFHTPGHTPDSVCFQIADLILTGDAFIPGIPTVTKLRGGNRQLADESIKRIYSRIDSNTVILPGHGESSLQSNIKL